MRMLGSIICQLLDMQYHPEIHENSLQHEVNNIKETWKTYLNDSIGLWEALSKTS